MKAPYDKLFLDPVVAKNPENAIRYLENEIEYIRKDALLEWAKDLNKCGATLLAVDTLIDKLNNF